MHSSLHIYTHLHFNSVYAHSVPHLPEDCCITLAVITTVSTLLAHSCWCLCVCVRVCVTVWPEGAQKLEYDWAPGVRKRMHMQRRVHNSVAKTGLGQTT